MIESNFCVEAEADTEVEFHIIRIRPLTRVVVWLFNLPIIRHLGGWYVAEWMTDHQLQKDIDDFYPAGEFEQVVFERLSPGEFVAELAFLADCEEFGEDPYDPDFQLDLFEDNDADFTLDDEDFEE